MANNLPQGMTQEMMRKALEYLMSQTIPVNRPSGLLQPNQIRGVNPGYKYEYTEYPKALTPPDVEIVDQTIEKQLRVKWKQPLPYNINDPQGKEYIEEYYNTQMYPKRASPPQIVVQSVEEEDAVRAAWRTTDGYAGTQLFPAWMFHVSKPPALVNNQRQMDQLGEGWYRTPQEVMDAAKGARPATQGADELQRDALIKRAEELDLMYDKRMSTSKLRQLVADAEAKLSEKAA